MKLAESCKEMEACAANAEPGHAERSIGLIELEYERTREALCAQTAAAA
jgi:hypothetical protein